MSLQQPQMNSVAAGKRTWPLPDSHEQDEILNNEVFKCKYITRSVPLGDGNFSVVKECMNIHTKELYAMKLINKQTVKGKLQLIQREFHLLKNLSQQIRFIEQANEENRYINTFQGHHHILQLFDYFETTANIVLITQLCQKDDLYEMITSNEKLDLQRQVKPYTACLISVLDFLHSQGVVHRDIKAENVLFRLNKNVTTSDNTTSYDLSAHDVILADFGLAIDMNNASDMSLKEYVGTMSYISPEIVKCKGIGLMTTQEINSITKYDTKVDIWALGVLVYFMAFGYTPFDCETDEETLECIGKCDYYIDDSKVNDVEYKEFWNFIQCCFVKDSAKRRSAHTLKNHPFVKEFFPYGDDENARMMVTSPSVTRLPKLKKNKSFTSLHNLKRPPVRRQSSSILSRIHSNNSLRKIHQSNLSPVLSTNPTPPPTAHLTPITNHSNNILRSDSNIHNHHNLVPLTPLTPSLLQQQHLQTQSSTLRGDNNNFAKIRDSLRRTISMTSIQNANNSQSDNSTTNNSSTYLSNGTGGDSTPSLAHSQFNLNNATNSTFFLDPQPPKGSLMNGVFCETPESLSNFNTTPRSSLSLSRQNSQSNEIHPPGNPNVLSRSSSYSNVKKTYFELDFEDD